MFGTLQETILSPTGPPLIKQKAQLSLITLDLYLSFDALMTTGRSFEQVISDPKTGASREIACRMVIRYK